MTENYTPPATWQRWADEGGEGAKMATEYEHGFADGRAAQAQELKRLQAQLEAVTAERDELSSLLAANVVVRAATTLELNGVTAERDTLNALLSVADTEIAAMRLVVAENVALKAQLNSANNANSLLATWKNDVPIDGILSVYEAASDDGYTNVSVRDWLDEQGRVTP